MYQQAQPQMIYNPAYPMMLTIDSLGGIDQRIDRMMNRDQGGKNVAYDTLVKFLNNLEANSFMIAPDS
jgi:hypothetical protein